MKKRIFDPGDPALLAWLATLKPQAELTMRYAMRALFPQVKTDRAFAARISTLLELLNPDAASFAKILADAGRLEATAAIPLENRLPPGAEDRLDRRRAAAKAGARKT